MRAGGPCTSGRRADLNEGLPQKGKRSGARIAAAPVGDTSMKGFPRRGSDRRRSGRRRRRASYLNEGLPQKGKRYGDGLLGVDAGEPTSMKGFPRRGSDFIMALKKLAAEIPQ